MFLGPVNGTNAVLDLIVVQKWTQLLRSLQVSKQARHFYYYCMGCCGVVEATDKDIYEYQFLQDNALHAPTQVMKL